MAGSSKRPDLASPVTVVWKQQWTEVISLQLLASCVTMAHFLNFPHQMPGGFFWAHMLWLWHRSSWPRIVLFQVEWKQQMRENTRISVGWVAGAGHGNIIQIALMTPLIPQDAQGVVDIPVHCSWTRWPLVVPSNECVFAWPLLSTLQLERCCSKKKVIEQNSPIWTSYGKYWCSGHISATTEQWSS